MRKRIVLDGIEEKEVRLTGISVVDGDELSRFGKRGGILFMCGWHLQIEGTFDIAAGGLNTGSPLDGADGTATTPAQGGGRGGKGYG